MLDRCHAASFSSAKRQWCPLGSIPLTLLLTLLGSLNFVWGKVVCNRDQDLDFQYIPACSHR